MVRINLIIITFIMLAITVFVLPASAQISINTFGQGGIRVGNNTVDCDASSAGTLRYNSAIPEVYFCNGGAWLVPGDSSLNNLTDVIVDYPLQNFFLGSDSGTSVTIGTHNLAIGYGSYNTGVAGQYDIAIGLEAMRYANDSGVLTPRRNIAVGYNALRGDTTPSNNTGTDNIALGYQAMRNNRSGSHNIAIGYDATNSNQASSYNIMFGRNTFQNYNGAGGRNIGIGPFVLLFGINNVSDNICLMSNSCNDMDTGSRNIISTSEQWPNGPTTSSDNVILGNSAGRGLTSGGGNIFLGHRAGFYGTAITTGSNNTLIGAAAGSNGAAYSNGTAIGYEAVLSGSDRIVFGNGAIGSIHAQVTSITGISDERRKQDITDSNLGLDFIKKLRPVAYRFNNGDETLRYGVIAQELLASLPPAMVQAVESAQGDINPYALIQRDTDEQRSYRVNYGELTAPLVKAIQEQQAMLDDNQKRIDAMNATLDAR